MTDTFEVYMHDVENATAVIQVRAGETVLTDTYDLRRVYPGTIQVLDLLGLELTEEAQLRAIDYVGNEMIKQMQSGTFPGDPVPSPIIEQDPPEPAPIAPSEYVQKEQPLPEEPLVSAVPMELPVKEEEDDAPNGNDQPVAG